MTGEIGAQILIAVTRCEKCPQQTLNCFRHVFRAAAVSDLPCDVCMLANSSSNTEIVGIYQVGTLLDLLAFEPNVGNPVLAAGIWAARNIQLERLIELRHTLFELLNQPTRECLRFGDCEFAEFRARARNRSAPKR